MKALQNIYDDYNAGSTGFCIAVETYCGFDLSRAEVERIAERAMDAEEFAAVMASETDWRDQ